MNRKITEQQVDDFFRSLGMEAEFDKLADSFADQFIIQGAVTEHLREALHRAPDSLLDLIWDQIVDQEATGEADRAGKEEILYQDIQDDLKANLYFMEPEKLILLIRIMNGHPIDLMETAIINEEFVPRGWVFTFLENDSAIFAVMDELRQIIASIKKSEVKQKISFIMGIRYIVNNCLGLYGVFRQQQIEDIYKRIRDERLENEKELEKINQYFDKLLPLFEEQGLIWLDGDYIISPYLETKEEYLDLLRRQGAKDYYVPDDGVIKSYASGKMLEKTPEYERVHQCLTRELRDMEQAEEMLEDIAGYIARDDWELPEVMNCLYDWDVIFENKKSAERMTAALSDWIFSVRRWSECGHRKKEQKMGNIEKPFISYSDRQEKKISKAAKVYPNDPCPCGSGKKYKKCCGR